MKPARLAVGASAIVALVALIAVVSCSKSNNSYTPTSPGGGTTKELNSGSLASGGGGYQHTVATAGTFPYYCTIHGTGMAGTVTVSASSAVDSVVVAVGPGLAFNPASATVKPGGHVRWSNNSGALHNVTSN